MRRHKSLVLADTYAVRLNAFDILSAASDHRFADAPAIRRVASDLDGVASRFADGKIAVTFTAFADLLRIAAMLVEWRRAVLDAESDPGRFKRGAIERITLWKSEYQTQLEGDSLRAVAQEFCERETVAEVGELCSRLSLMPMPVGVYGDVEKYPPPGLLQVNNDSERKISTELSVAFLNFTVDGECADQIHFLTPHETHDLEIEVRVSRWPEEATELRLTPVTIETEGSYDFPTFSLARPKGDPPFKVHQRGRATIKAAQALRAQPFEFRYAAEFWPKGSEQPISVVGHRTLRIESLDPRRSPLTGYPLMDQRLLQVRNNLRRVPAMPQGDLEAAMALAIPLVALASRAVQDDLFPKPISEAEFQRRVRDELRRCPEIGGDLEEHAHAGGGETDLSLRGVRLELKVEPAQKLELADCQRYVEQTASYAVGSGKRVGLLCLLDASPKKQAPFPAEEGVGILLAESRLPIVTVLIQGGLANPSAHSRKGRKH